MAQLWAFCDEIPFEKADGTLGYASDPASFKEALDALPDFRNTVARIIVAAASTEDVKRRTSLSALLSDKTRFAWMNQLERFSGNLKYQKKMRINPL